MIEKPQIYDKVLSAAIRNLKYIDCAFKIVDVEGNEYEHEVERVLGKAHRGANRFASGVVLACYLEFVQDLEPGQVANVPFDDEVPELRIQSSACQWMAKNWGAGTFTTHLNRDKNVVEVLRLK
jgi:hypothetical protein